MNGMANGHNGQANAAQSLGLQWNPKHLEIKTRSVEKTLEPLVMQVMKRELRNYSRFGFTVHLLMFQVTTLVSSKSPQKKKGKSKRAHVLVAAVERATANFVERGKLIARENPDIEPEMLQAVEEVQTTGETMGSAARDFASDPCSSAKRGNMVGNKFTLLFFLNLLMVKSLFLPS